MFLSLSIISEAGAANYGICGMDMKSQALAEEASGWRGLGSPAGFLLLAAAKSFLSATMKPWGHHRDTVND